VTRIAVYKWVDNAGNSGQGQHFAAANPCSILTNMQAVSRCGIAWNVDGPVDGAIGVPSAGAFPSVEDTARLIFQKGDGSLVSLLIQAPDDSIFLADGVTVDPTTIVALIAACVGELSDQAGTTVTAYVAGVRQ
jgi:hypothetical protein